MKEIFARTKKGKELMKGMINFILHEKEKDDFDAYFIDRAIKLLNRVEKATGKSVEIPKSLEELMKQEKFTTEINPQYEELKGFLLGK